MSARSFRSVFMVASCAGAALGCYLVSLRVASERAALEDVETRIVFAQRDVRMLQTEIGTRGRLAQLERWNASFGLNAPSADQILGGTFELARLNAPDRRLDLQAPVVLAALPAPEKPTSAAGAATDDDADLAQATDAPAGLLHQASLKTAPRQAETVAAPVNLPTAATRTAATGKPDGKPAIAEARAATPKKSVDKAALVSATPMTKPVKLAKADPLAPLPVASTSKSHAKDQAKGK